MRKSDYTYDLFPNLLLIRDLNKGNTSVTNNAEIVLNEINTIENFNKNITIFARDSCNIWDQMIPIWDDNICIDVTFKIFDYTDNDILKLLE